MRILTITTKRSVRETLKELRYTKYYSSASFNAGDMIEIIDGNKKSPAIVLKSEPASAYKQEIRDGTLETKKLKLSKSGEYADGALIENFDMTDIKKYLKSPALVHKTGQYLAKEILSQNPTKASCV